MGGIFIVYKFINRTTKEQFLKSIEFSKNKIKKIDKNKWEITDRFLNKWQLIFTSVNQFTVINNKVPFWVDIYIKGKNIEILKAEINNRKLKSARFLKKFDQLSILISCYFQFGYLKLI